MDSQHDPLGGRIQASCTVQQMRFTVILGLEKTKIKDNFFFYDNISNNVKDSAESKKPKFI
jgi:hypothetical protein